MRFKMRFEGEEAPEQRYGQMILQCFIIIKCSILVGKYPLIWLVKIIGLLVPLLEQKILIPKGGEIPNGDASRLYLQSFCYLFCLVKYNACYNVVTFVIQVRWDDIDNYNACKIMCEKKVSLVKWKSHLLCFSLPPILGNEQYSTWTQKSLIIIIHKPKAC